ncbi:type II toxin-antitoxin system HicB family antitoxin [Coraliomargarita sinensis]|uniref:Type II toxin-antitoxin system HicB family antitoxin n=2 Tax=Coraliomargarita sinensis TaxID=2174842 RepID=A0A317ZFB9_9BACT|nr:type II toxin-antitoxin system HicB family antitoxin [Coraliomargarita sinensis]PXA04156.1 type II toxin-antitoxin system HicB family antitoxin [Coraliomargarita sinensis]
MKIKAIIHEAEEGGFWAEVPALPGCSTQGETLEELTENLKDAIALWLDVGEDEIEPESTDRILEVAV